MLPLLTTPRQHLCKDLPNASRPPSFKNHVSVSSNVAISGTSGSCLGHQCSGECRQPGAGHHRPEHAQCPDHGAFGDGVHNDTAAFQSALVGLGAAGGTVEVPAGKYMIDTATGIVMLNATRLLLDNGAELDAIPNNYANHNGLVMINGVSNVEITGGQIVGERNQHIGTTGEWGHGIYVIGGKHVDIHDTQVSNFWGDGIYITRLIGAPDNSPGYSQSIRIYYVTSQNNRRQGLTVEAAQRVWVGYSKFLNTSGTAPQDGIDIEPNDPNYPSDDIEIGTSEISGNAGTGIDISNNDTNIAIKQSTIENNAGFGIQAIQSSQGTILGNTISGNGFPGIQMHGGAQNYQIDGNNFSNNAFTWNGMSDSPQYDVYVGNVVFNTKGLQTFKSALNIEHSGNQVDGQPVD